MAFAVALVVVVLALGSLEYYTYETMNNQLSSTKTDLNAQISGLQDAINSQRNSITSLLNSVSQDQQAESASAQQVSTIEGSLQSLQTKLASVSSQLNSTTASDSASLQQISTQLQNISSTIKSLSTKVASLTPQVPLSTLVIISDTYDNATQTFQFTVQNTQTVTVYAQLEATLWGTSCEFYNNQGSYVSQVYTFTPLSNTVTTLNLNLGAYQSNGFCGHTPVVDLTMSYLATSTTVSETYTFNVIPYYTWS